MHFDLSSLKSWWTHTLATLEYDSRKSQATLDAHRIDTSAMSILILSAILVTYLYYYGSSRHYTSLEWWASWFISDANQWIEGIFQDGDNARLARLTYWSSTTVLAYFVVPALWIKLIFKQRLSDYGLSFRGALTHRWIYIGMYLLMLPLLLLVSQWPSFQNTYPFYEFAGRSLYDFILWQIIYGMQFFALEFFYRGFLIHGLKHRFGIYAIAVSMIPYCMIHFGKPIPETLGAIVAGLALGFLALYTRTIWLGVAIHISIAMTMDILSLLAQGKLL